MSQELTRIEDLVRANLIGYGRADRAALAAIATYPSWWQVAMCELERRLVRVIESLPIEEVEAIARRQINLNELASQALADLDLERK
ncbi:MAG: hypothetical protein PIQ35_27415 [Achromobacter xylosoxidans]